MAPPVRFLEQLMPAAQHGGAFVRAALPSRFAPPTFDIESRDSLGLRSADDTGERDEATVVPQDRPRRSPDDSTPTTRPSPSPAARAVVSDGAVVHVTQPHTKAAAPRERAESSAATADPLSQTPSHTSAPTIQRQNPAEVTAVRRERSPATARTASSIANASRLAKSAPANAISRPPLREHVREQRIAPSSVQQPTIVQVTIDRIDVRAPAANATPERPASKPRNASWKSLGDYLRQRDGANGGAS